MAQLLEEIEWSAQILQPVADPAWEAEIKRRGGRVSEVDRRVSPSAWLREACLRVTTYRPERISQRLANIGALVTAQENSCRYCYGANRAYMKVLGYSESFISRIERDAHMAELDAMERGFITFCRHLARSRPRPAKAEREGLIALGYTPIAVSEIAFLISMGCFYNRVGILSACPPELNFERMANGPLGRLMGLAAPLLRPFMGGGKPVRTGATQGHQDLAQGSFGPLVSTLDGLAAAGMLKDALDGCFASKVLSRRSKALMFAIVGRTLACRFCEDSARDILVDEAMESAEIDATLATLDSTSLGRNEALLLPWVRDTVYYQTAAIQQQTRLLAAQIGPTAVLEAIGVAALANATVRMAMLLE
ncbi:MAG: hypothetical protein ABI343_00820 [Burkholderiaceae bacterium]